MSVKDKKYMLLFVNKIRNSSLPSVYHCWISLSTQTKLNFIQKLYTNWVLNWSQCGQSQMFYTFRQKYFYSDELLYRTEKKH